jgi:hypothetical protein
MCQGLSQLLRRQELGAQSSTPLIVEVENASILAHASCTSFNEGHRREGNIYPPPPHSGPWRLHNHILHTQCTERALGPGP